jgi:hypothetical protein
MGTDGLYVFKYNKKYYVYHKGNDSYPRGLGKTIINELQLMSAEDLVTLKYKILTININDKYENSYCGYTNLMHSISNPHEYAFYITDSEPKTEIGINYIYIIDMDKNVFVVKWCGETERHKVIFDIQSIPVEWCNLIETYEED